VASVEGAMSHGRTTAMLPLVSAGAALAEHAAAIRSLGKRVIGDVIEIGRRLTEAKALIEDDARKENRSAHAAWLHWIDREFAWNETTARNFLNVHGLVENKSANFADLNLPVSGLYLLAAPSTPEAARAEVIELAENGEALSVGEIKDTIDQARARTDTKGRKQPTSKASQRSRRKRKSKLVVEGLSSLSWSQADAQTRRKFVDAVGVLTIVGTVGLDYVIAAVPPGSDYIITVLVNVWNRASAEERARFLQFIGAEINDAGAAP
jgi:hypothetical protein